MSLSSGTVIDDRYVVESTIGRGGMGEVYRATDRRLKQDVALKLMDPAFREESHKKRFKREVEVALQLETHHIAKVRDLGELGDGTPYIVMELLQGADLEQILEREGPLSPPVAIGYIIEASLALAELHQKSVIHRDIKPANLFLDEKPFSRNIKVLDFGISKPVFEKGTAITQPFQALGTPNYMSPEQFRMEEDLDVRSDTWALGVVLYELTTGKLPFTGTPERALHHSILKDEPRPPHELSDEISEELSQVILRCLSKQREERFGNVGELAGALLPFCSPSIVPMAERLSIPVDSTQPYSIGNSVPPVSSSAYRDGGTELAAPPTGGVTASQEICTAMLKKDWGDQTKLFERFNPSVEVVFLLGAGIHAQGSGGHVPGGWQLIENFKVGYRTKSKDESAFLDALTTSPKGAYFGALECMNVAPRQAKQIISRAVRGALSEPERDAERSDDELAGDPSAWSFSAADLAVAEVLSQSREGFAPFCLTTNFDPLLKLAIEKHTPAQQLIVRLDGSLPHHNLQKAPSVVQLHGDWIPERVSHVEVGTLESRGELQETLNGLLRDRRLVVLGYGGADPILMDAICRSVEEGICQDIVWCFRERSRTQIVETYPLTMNKLQGLPSDRVEVFKDIEVQDFLPKLWKKAQEAGGKRTALQPGAHASNPAVSDHQQEEPVSGADPVVLADSDRNPVAIHRDPLLEIVYLLIGLGVMASGIYMAVWVPQSKPYGGIPIILGGLLILSKVFHMDLGEIGVKDGKITGKGPLGALVSLLTSAGLVGLFGGQAAKATNPSPGKIAAAATDSKEKSEEPIQKESKPEQSQVRGSGGSPTDSDSANETPRGTGGGAADTGISQSSPKPSPTTLKTTVTVTTKRFSCPKGAKIVIGGTPKKLDESCKWEGRLSPGAHSLAAGGKLAGQLCKASPSMVLAGKPTSFTVARQVAPKQAKGVWDPCMNSDPCSGQCQ